MTTLNNNNNNQINNNNNKSNNDPLQELSDETKFTQQELNHLCSVMLRAQKFEEEEESRTIEGQLSKYTNVVKGWQYRWFIIDPLHGTLVYYTLEDKRKPRGCIKLAGCQIIPSDEDSQTFSVYAACGEVYKLKAFDAKDRQIWVDNLRLATQKQEDKLSGIGVQHPNPNLTTKSSNISSNPKTYTGNQVAAVNSLFLPDLTNSSESVQTQLNVVKRNCDAIVDLIEKITNKDEDLLLLKASSMAARNSLEQCFSILESLE